MSVLEDVVKSVVFHNPENGYTVLHLEGGDTLVGKAQAVWPGENIVAEGEWIDDKVHGRQFKATTLTCIAPKTLKGIEKYLASGLVKGVGPKLAAAIVAKFGEDTLNVLSHQSQKLLTIPKLGKRKVEQIRQSWHANESMRENMIFGQTYGISIAKMTKIVKRYGPDAISVIKADPYRLCRDIWGIGFLTADKIALSVGIEPNSLLRARAVIGYTLETEAEEGGHCWTFANDLLLHANELTAIPVEILAEALKLETADSRVVQEGERVYLRPLYRAEKSVAERISAILRTPHRLKPVEVERAVKWWEAKSGMKLAVRQQEALEQSLKSKFSIITGGPGVGKTTIIKALVDIFRARKEQVVLAAPTGRAAKRMTESVGVTAQTIHRLLKWNPGTNRFTFDAERKYEGDVFIFDEASMIDVKLAMDLLSAIPDQAVVVLVGDTDQLPSVGAGNVLGDLIKSGKIPSVKLEVIFRQDASGLIVRNAHHINEGQPLELRRGDTDFYFVRIEDPEECVKRVIELVTERIPRKFGFDPMEEVQVLSPMRRNALGTDNLNYRLQAALGRGQGAASISRGAFVFREGDRVMQIRNNYDKDVYNGDVGFIRRIDPVERRMVVEFDGRPVSYDPGDLDELVLAYAITIHKSQGSEYPAVIVLMHTQHYMMLERNLLYTAITRGKKLVLLLGVPYAVDKAIQTNTVRERRTSLWERL